MPVAAQGRADLDVLFLAAFAPELAALDRWRASADGSAEGTRTGSSAVGIGMVASSAGAATGLRATRPRAVVLLGTCGAYVGSAIDVGAVVVSAAVALADPAALAGAAQFPEPMTTRVDADRAMHDALVGRGARSVAVAATLAITVDDAAADFVRATSGAHVEHLEAFSVAAACANAGVPFVALLGVANRVGSRAREEWRAHHRSASDRAAELAIRWIGEGAPGVPPRLRVP